MTDSTLAAAQSTAVSAWDRFWFYSEHGATSLQVVRIGLSLIAAWYFLSHWADIGLWFAGDGILATEQLGRLIEAEDLVDQYKWRLSPLYWVESTVLLRIYLAIGVLLAIAACVLHTTRAAAVLLWLWCVWLANRSLVISGPEELALVFGLAYIAIASPENPFHWATALARRLIQVHTTLLVVITGLTMLASMIWWDGSGSLSLAAPVGRRMLDVTGMLESLWLQDLVTHLLVLTAILAPIAIWVKRTRRAAQAVLLVWLLLVA
ncbi:MAG: hypothetical protein ACO1RT_04590, partial [Planctomycetaceae bacterium]